MSDHERDRPPGDPSQLSENLGRISLDNSGTSYAEEVPPERPAPTETPIQYLTVKNRLFQVYRTISDWLTSTHPSSYAEVIRLDKVLDGPYKAIPLCS
jgi:hypothetical protein